MQQLPIIPDQPRDCLHWIGGKWEKSKNLTAPSKIFSPYNGAHIGTVFHADPEITDRCVMVAAQAQSDWRMVPIKERSAVLFRAREIFLSRLDQISSTISAESGKTLAEAKAGLLKGVEVLEYALSIQNLDLGGKVQVSRGVWCEYRREPIGVVAGITPFNFPAMVPMWMMPIAIVLGNAFIWKPSDKVALTSLEIAEVFSQAGLPKGILSVLQGGPEVVQTLCKHPRVEAVGFVGSTPIAKKVYMAATAEGKRALTLGGAKNPIILMPDADPKMTFEGISSSYTGCAGQRCMASSLLIAVGPVDSLIDGIVEKSRQIKQPHEMGAIISKESLLRLQRSIETATQAGAKSLLDGRRVQIASDYQNGNWLGACILDRVTPQSEAACEELFGPILSIVRVKNLSEALELHKASLFGNAVSVFTQNGDIAERVATEAQAGMVGVNIGVPVPREPFSFGGFKQSRFGCGDITGEGGLNFWSQVKKVTTKWALQSDQTWMG